MQKILIVWELGSGLGHVMRVGALAAAFAKRGCHVTVALRDLADCSSVGWPADVDLLQAPVSFRAPRGFNDPSNYAEILYTNGYHDPRVLDGLAVGWTTLLHLTAPDIVVVDHAPTAVLAAKIMDIPSVRLGTGFFSPPDVQPFPSFRTWQTVDVERAAAVERYVLEAINVVVQPAGLRFDALFKAVQPDLDLISSWPELDHYREYRGNAISFYVGNEMAVGGDGAVMEWSASPGKKVLAYLKADYVALPEVLCGLQQGGAQVVAYVAGFSADDIAAWSSPRLTIVSRPLALHAMLSTCDAMVCHAGSGTVALCLEHEVPVFLLPYTAEQFLYSQRILESQVGLFLTDLDARLYFAEKFLSFIARSDFVSNIQMLKSRNAVNVDAIEQTVDRCAAFLVQGVVRGGRI